MGELFSYASPHGAVRSIGISDLGLDFATEVGEQKLPGSAPRALLYRELGVRVAHFLRSSFMAVGPELANRELLRMRDGVPRLVDWLCRKSVNTNIEAAANGIFEMFEILMHQISTLRTKRFVHGSLIPSNFCIDGRFLDFTTSTAVSTLQPVMVSLGGVTTQQQHHQILNSLPDLLFYISKFDERCAVLRPQLQEITEYLIGQLNRRHHEFLVEEHLNLFGFSVQQLASIDRGAKNELFSALIRVIDSGSTEGHLYFGGDEHAMLPQAGRDDIFAAIALAIQAESQLRFPCTENYQPNSSAFPPDVLHGLVCAFRSAARSIKSETLQGVDLGMSWLIRAMQRNADISPLYRRNLDGVIDEVCRSKGDFGVLIENMISDWKGILQCSRNGSIELNGWLLENNLILSSDGFLSGENGLARPLEIGNCAFAARSRPRHRWLLDVARINQSDDSMGSDGRLYKC